MVVYPYLINHGFLLYRDIINPYPPLLTFFLAIFTRLVGYKVLGFEILTWLIIILIDLTIFYVSYKIFKKSQYALASLAFFVLLSVPFLINGFWFDLVQTPFIVFSIWWFWLFLKNPQKRKFLFWSVFSLTLAFFIKQQIIWLLFWYLLILIYKFRTKTLTILKENLLVTIPFLVLALGQLIYFLKLGIFGDFVFWTLYFPFLKASQMPGYVLWPTIRQAAIIGSTYLLFLPIITKQKLENLFFLITGLVLLMFAYPRFDYFHLIPALSVLSLSVGPTVNFLGKSKFQVSVVTGLFFIFISLFTLRYYLNNWTDEVRFFEREILDSASSLKEMTRPNQIVYIQNGPDQLFPLATVQPPKPWADEFSWYLELAGMQDKIVTAIQKEQPRIAVYQPYGNEGRYELGSYRPNLIANYLEEYYQNSKKLSDSLWVKIPK